MGYFSETELKHLAYDRQTTTLMWREGNYVCVILTVVDRPGTPAYIQYCGNQIVYQARMSDVGLYRKSLKSDSWSYLYPPEEWRKVIVGDTNLQAFLEERFTANPGVFEDAYKQRIGRARERILDTMERS